ncbi:MAG: thioredoxin family protein [Planctomycetota bacterium]|nr:thioredoxin family protein [Planctomycetota bacterium]MDA1178890.1 thioredoxin family protein [Planctomycetota bacterium]
MQRNVIQGIVTSLTFLFVMTQTAVAQEGKWLDSPDEAAKVAARSGKMIVVSVGADWCHYCKRMDRETWADGKVQQAIKQNYVPLKLTDERHHELLAAMQIKAFPTTLVFTSDRRFLTKMEGYVDAEIMALQLEQIRIADGQRATKLPPVR